MIVNTKLYSLAQLSLTVTGVGESKISLLIFLTKFSTDLGEFEMSLGRVD